MKHKQSIYLAYTAILIMIAVIVGFIMGLL